MSTTVAVATVEEIEVVTQTCRVCGETKALDAFTRDTRRANGHDTRCRDCGSKTGTVTASGRRYPQLQDRGWLYENYDVKRRSLASIAGELGCTASGVHKALKHHGIHRRPRGDTPQFDAPWSRYNNEPLPRLPDDPYAALLIPDEADDTPCARLRRKLADLRYLGYPFDEAWTIATRLALDGTTGWDDVLAETRPWWAVAYRRSGRPYDGCHPHRD